MNMNQLSHKLSSMKQPDDEENNNAHDNENVPSQYKDDIDKRINDIQLQIELIGKICDTKMAQSYDEYHNTIKSSKAQLWDDLTKLNFKLIEYKKQNTKEDYINKLKTDLKVITQQVQTKDKELTKNEKLYEELEEKVNQLNEERGFLNKELKNSSYYNKYLKTKLNHLENMSPEEVFKEYESKDIIENSRNIELNKDYSNNNSENESDDEYKNLNSRNNNNKETTFKAEKLEYYLSKNKDIIDNKIYEVESKLDSKYKKLNSLEKFKNPTLQVLFEKTLIHIEKIKEDKLNKISNKNIFFENSKKDSLIINNSSIIENSSIPTIDSSLLHNRDKREIVKEFLSDEMTKRIIYSIIYKTE